MQDCGYNHKKIEKKWQKIWQDCNTFKASLEPGKPKKYVLEMLPYPSGRMHMGHIRNYALGDVFARMHKSMGFNVLHPMGWDAFGLPAENAAIQNNISPATWTKENIATMKEVLIEFGFAYDWSREIVTCSSDYYKHEQQFFLDFYKSGLLYRKEELVNWDPVDQTVLANEQVVDGKGWRSGAVVEKKELKQWFFKISDFAEELLADLNQLEGWPSKVKVMQEKWIGRSEGVEINFLLKGSQDFVRVYTTRPETLFGASFIGVALDHPIVDKIPRTTELEAFLQECHQGGTAEDEIAKSDKKGFNTKLTAIHPFDSEVELPIFITNFVLSSYASGAIFGCPAHDARDHEFALKYCLPIKRVVMSKESSHVDLALEPFLGDGVIINSDFLNGLTIEEAKLEVIKHIENKKLGEKKVCYRLRDWGVSRQRYWGCPIPIVYCEDCGVVPNDSLPVKLPDNISFAQSGNPLDYHPTWKYVDCPKCGRSATRETDTLDTFFESSWYFLRYCSPKSSVPFDLDEVNYWMPVDNYIGGIEHAVMHLLYARFFVKALKKIGYIDLQEPFSSLLTQGMVNHETYKDQSGSWLYPEEVVKSPTGAVHRVTNEPVILGRVEKMSKSKKNIADPNRMLEKYGADAVRMFVLSDSPPDRDLEWTEAGAEGCYKYLAKVYKMVENFISSCESNHSTKESDAVLERAINAAILNVTNDLHSFHCNKAIARLREFTNVLFATHDASLRMRQEGLETLLTLLNPIAPHVTEELWSMLNKSQSDVLPLAVRGWPLVDSSALMSEHVVIAVQVNGKLRATMEVLKDSNQSEIEGQALSIVNVVHFLSNKVIKKVIYIPNKIINIVCG